MDRSNLFSVFHPELLFDGWYLHFNTVCFQGRERKVDMEDKSKSELPVKLRREANHRVREQKREDARLRQCLSLIEGEHLLGILIKQTECHSWSN